MEKSDWKLTVTAGRSGGMRVYHVTTTSGDIQSYTSLPAAKRAVSRFLEYQNKYGRWVSRDN